MATLSSKITIPNCINKEIKMNKALTELIKISNTTGKDPALTQGGGGNTSVKTTDRKHMYIKASGTALKDMGENSGYRRMNLDSVLQIIENNDLAKLPANKREVQVVNRLLNACDDDIDTNARPSVEAHLHALLNDYVIHLHPNAVGAYVNAKNGKALVEKLFQNRPLPPLWVPYVDPGFMLAKKIQNLVSQYKNKYKTSPSILFLEKHGLFITADSADKALDLVKEVIKTCNSKLTQPSVKKLTIPNPDKVKKTTLAIRNAFFQATGNYTFVTHFHDEQIASFLQEKEIDKMLKSAPLAPDELVYGNGPALLLKDTSPNKIVVKINSQLNKNAKPPKAFLVKDQGLFVADKSDTAKIIRDIVESSMFIRKNAFSLGGIETLNTRQQQFINQWESEAFRKQLAISCAQGQLTDRIAVVTGAGSGLGKSIAIGLARAGASVALVDMDSTAAIQTSEFIKNQNPKVQTLDLKCNVTDEKEVDTAYDEILKTFGGLDILVNAAGIAPAAPLIDMPLDKWKMALEVNLTGYFLMARAAARIMITQDIGGSIINLTSKSGLEASKNNSAYNATKAGEIHLARGWALELGQHEIRVNCVAAGNVFEGSKIWNPQYIKTCAQKYGIEPDQVIPYYVSKTALNKEIKGQDIADSIVFLCSDNARRITGQTLVTDAGQVMVR